MRVRPGSLAFILMLGCLGALPPLATDMGLPALDAISAGLGVTQAAAALTLSVFMLGFALGPIAYGPISDRFGRRPVLLAGTLAFTVGGITCALAPTLPVLLLARLLQGTGAGAGMVLAFAIVRDTFEGDAARAQLSWMSVIMNIAPMVAPTIGALLLAGGWRLIYATMGLAGGLLALLLLLGLPETGRIQPPGLLWRVLPNYRRVLGHRLCLGYALVNACNFGNLFAYITGAPLVLMGARGLSAPVFALLFGLAALGLMAGGAISGQMARRGVPERVPMVVGLGLSTAASIGLLLGGSTAPVPVMVALLVANAVCRGLVAPNATHGVLRKLPSLAGSASAILGCLQMLLGALAGGLVALLGVHQPAFAMGAVMALFAGGAAAFYVLLVTRDGADGPEEPA